MPDLVQQPTPTASKCPRCGGEHRESDVTHRLSALGYLHDDVHLTCADCGRDWVCGVPIGDPPKGLAADLFCDHCEAGYANVHRVGVDDRGWIYLHMKCPNPDCYSFWKVKRDTDENGLALVGYPQTTGSTDGANPHGWADE